VRLDGVDVRTRVAVVAAGCGAARLLAERWPHDRPARTRRIRYAVLAAPGGPGGPSIPALVDLTTGMWGRPDGSDGVLAGRPVAEWDVPVRAGTGLGAAELAWIREGVAARLPALADAPALLGRFGTDLYTAAGPVVGAVPGMPRVVLAAAWSGGGFKTAPAAGELAADAACAALDGAAGGQPEPLTRRPRQRPTQRPTEREGDSHADTRD
jgi:glycine/D-amino acid oxidase-like deaminating enzyme